MGNRSKPRKAGKIAGECISCSRKLTVHARDDSLEALKRKRWSNITGDQPPYRAICQSCRKKGNHG